MTKKCIYCNSEMPESCVMDVCTPCGHQVWGEKMFAAIIENMEGARESGDLYQGSVTDSISEKRNVPEAPIKNEENKLTSESIVKSNTSSSLFQESSQNQQSNSNQLKTEFSDVDGLVNVSSESKGLSDESKESSNPDSDILTI